MLLLILVALFRKSIVEALANRSIPLETYNKTLLLGTSKQSTSNLQAEEQEGKKKILKKK